MPTASEFRHVADVLDDTRRRLDDLTVSLGSLDARRSITGPRRVAVDATVGVSLANLGTMSAELSRQAVEARHRAAVCEAYTDAYRRFLQSDDLSTPPRRPASWVRYG